MLIGNLLFTLGIIAHFYNIPFFSVNVDKRTSKSVDISWTWKQSVLVLLGIVVSLVCLISFVLFIIINNHNFLQTTGECSF